MSKKLTVVEKYGAVMAMLRGESSEVELSVEDAVAFIGERKAQTERKNASGSKAERKPTAQQLENAKLKEQIMVALEGASEPMCASDIGKAVGCDNNYRVSALLGQMCKVTAGGKTNEDGVLDRTEVKGRAYFAVAK